MTLAFVMTTGFITDTANLPLTVSNLMNVALADFSGLNSTRYAFVIISVDAVAIVVMLIMLHLFFRRVIPATY